MNIQTILSRLPVPDLIRERLLRDRRMLLIPRLLNERLSEAQKKIHNEKQPRCGGPPATVAEQVKHYAQRLTTLKIKGPSPLNAKGINSKRAQDLAIRLQVAEQFLKLAKSSERIIQPILLYYALSNACGVLSQAYLDWEHLRETHGLRVQTANDLRKIELIFLDDGSFQRLATALFLFNGVPTRFQRLISFAQEPVLSPPRTERVDVHSRLSLSAIESFDYFLDMQRIQYCNGVSTTGVVGTISFLLDYALVFTGSWLARYQMARWQEIIEGKTSGLRLMFDDAFTRIQDYGFDVVLSLLTDPSVSIDKAHPIPHHPYTFRHERFRT